jgi:HK97 family phage prohead protease
MELIRKVHTDSKRKGMSFVLSDETPDRLGDVIMSDGWQLEEFRANPAALFAHQKDFLVGTWENLRIDNRQLIADLKPAPKGTSDRIDEITRLVEAGILRAASVGFTPIEKRPRKIDDRRVGEIYIKQTLLETSLVAIPANPNSLAIMKSLEISEDTRKLVFVELDKSDKPKRRADHLGEFAKLTELERWSPAEVRKAKLWIEGFAKTYPDNRFYRKLYRLFDEMEVVRTIQSLAAAELGTKGRAS